ncbi:MAG: elongation factor G [Phycisphaeraceae bacterium]|nr:elongation factor G [Phycisphaeraceae bacterium]
MTTQTQSHTSGSQGSRSVADVRNICLVGSGGAGKTTLTERLLYSAGSIKRAGTVEEGNTVSDFSDEEKHHKHSLQPSFVHFDYEGHEVHLIDTPGLVDFIGHAIACFPAVETVAVVIDAHKGIDSVARRLMTVAADRKIPRMIIINKMEENADGLESLVENIRETFGAICLPINLPTLKGKKVINVFEHDGHDSAGDQTDFSSVHAAHKAIVEQVIEVDDELTMEYLEKGEGAGFDPAKLHAAFEKALGEAHLVPICFCSAKTGAGVDDLLHVFSSLCPSPLEVSPPELEIRKGVDAEGKAIEEDYLPKPDPQSKVIAHVFKVMTDAFVGKLGIFRVHSGTIKHKQELYIDDNSKPFRVGHLFKLQGKEHVEVSEVGPGEIAAISKVDELHFNGILHESPEASTVHLRPLPLPKPLYGLAIQLKNLADETKFSTASHKMMAEDPSLKIERISATNQTVMRGLGELHLRIVIEKFKKQANIELVTSPPKVAYKETITSKADGHHRHRKQTGGSGQFGEVYLRIEPLPADHPTGFEFASEVVGGTVPRQYWPAVEKGVKQIIDSGAFAGYPMQGIRVALYDGKYHDVDSKEIAFITAGKKAFIEAVAKAKPKLLEPYVMVEVTAPSRYMGDIAGHLSTKRGRVQDSQIQTGDTCLVRAVAPLGELANYANELKSMTGGAGSFSMDYSHDEQTPPQVQAAVVAAFKPQEEKD